MDLDASAFRSSSCVALCQLFWVFLLLFRDSPNHVVRKIALLVMELLLSRVTLTLFHYFPVYTRKQFGTEPFEQLMSLAACSVPYMEVEYMLSLQYRLASHRSSNSLRCSSDNKMLWYPRRRGALDCVYTKPKNTPWVLSNESHSSPMLLS